MYGKRRVETQPVSELKGPEAPELGSLCPALGVRGGEESWASHTRVRSMMPAQWTGCLLFLQVRLDKAGDTSPPLSDHGSF